MEFVGQIKKMLPARSGVSERSGNVWKAQPFIFEYYEHESDRYPDSVVLETFDDNIMAQLEEFAKVKIGFGHRTREYEGKVFNDLRIYKFERLGGAQQAAQPANTAQTANSPQPQNNAPQGNENQGGGSDDLPF